MTFFLTFLDGILWEQAVKKLRPKDREDLDKITENRSPSDLPVS